MANVMFVNVEALNTILDSLRNFNNLKTRYGIVEQSVLRAFWYSRGGLV